MLRVEMIAVRALAIPPGEMARCSGGLEVDTFDGYAWSA